MEKKRTRKPGAGRPSIDKADRKEKIVRVRLTEEDLNRLAKLHGVTNHKSLSELIRTILYKEHILVQIEETGLEQLSALLYYLSSDLRKLIKSKNSNAEAVKEKAIEMQNQLLLVKEFIMNSKYHSLLMDRLNNVQ